METVHNIMFAEKKRDTQFAWTLWLQPRIVSIHVEKSGGEYAKGWGSDEWFSFLFKNHSLLMLLKCFHNRMNTIKTKLFIAYRIKPELFSLHSL